MVDAGVKAEVLDHMAAFLSSASHANHAATFDFGDLANGCPHGAGGGGHNHGFTGFRLANFQEACMCRIARHSENPERPRGICRVFPEVHDFGAIRDRVILPAATG